LHKNETIIFAAITTDIVYCHVVNTDQTVIKNSDAGLINICCIYSVNCISLWSRYNQQNIRCGKKTEWMEMTVHVWISVN